MSLLVIDNFNGPLKKCWAKEVAKYLRQEDIVCLNKHVFHKVFNPVWEEMSSKRSLFVEGFAYCGLSPPKNTTVHEDFETNKSFHSTESKPSPISCESTSSPAFIAIRNVASSPKK
jgi:hypothetical protein